MRYYIIDKTIGKNPIFFNQLNETINHLEGTCKRLTGTSRIDYMLNRVDLGHPADEATGRNFVEAMSENIEMGVFKNNGFVRCNICDVEHYSRYTNEMGQ